MILLTLFAAALAQMPIRSSGLDENLCRTSSTRMVNDHGLNRFEIAVSCQRNARHSDVWHEGEAARFEADAERGQSATMSEQLALYDRESPTDSVQDVPELYVMSLSAGARGQRSVAGGYAGAPRYSAHAPAQALATSSQLDAMLTDVGTRFGVDPAFLRAVAQVESHFHADAVSSKGAIGLMQVMPGTGASLGLSRPAEQLREAQTNLEAGARYLKRLQRHFGNNLPLVLAAYNAGEGAVKKFGNNVPNYPETKDYVRKVMSVYLAEK